MEREKRRERERAGEEKIQGERERRGGRDSEREKEQERQGGKGREEGREAEREEGQRDGGREGVSEFWCVFSDTVRVGFPNEPVWELHVEQSPHSPAPGSGR